MNPKFSEILGQQSACEMLSRMLDSERIPQAMIFQGPEGVGKATTAQAFASALMCPDGGCGNCSICAAVARRQHPDLMIVERQPREGSSDELRSFIVVDQIRQVSHMASMAPRESRRRIFLIDPADRMNPESQNALLKTLEEPPHRALLILIAARPHLLLTTVRSRSMAVRFGAVPFDELTALLERRGIDPAEAAVRASLAEGAPGKALDLDLELLQERREALLGSLEALARSATAISDLPAMATALAGKDSTSLHESLDLLQTLLRDAARSGSGDAERQQLIHADLSDRLASLGQALGAARAAELVRAVERLRHETRFNLNRTLIAESLLAAVAGGPLP